MDCSRISEIAGSLVDHEPLSEEERQFVERHLRVCEACRQEFELEEATKRLFRTRIPLVEVPAETYTSLWERLEAAE